MLLLSSLSLPHPLSVAHIGGLFRGGLVWVQRGGQDKALESLGG